MAVQIISDFRKGRKTRKGQELTPGPPKITITAVSPDCVQDFVGARNRVELRSHLLKLKASGVLVHEPGRLTQRCRRPNRDERWYCFRGTPGEVPKYRRSGSRRVHEW